MNYELMWQRMVQRWFDTERYRSEFDKMMREREAGDGNSPSAHWLELLSRPENSRLRKLYVEGLG